MKKRHDHRHRTQTHDESAADCAAPLARNVRAHRGWHG
jgi:hypothetical protein